MPNRKNYKKPKQQIKKQLDKAQNKKTLLSAVQPAKPLLPPPSSPMLQPPPTMMQQAQPPQPIMPPPPPPMMPPPPPMMPPPPPMMPPPPPMMPPAPPPLMPMLPPPPPTPPPPSPPSSSPNPMVMHWVMPSAKTNPSHENYPGGTATHQEAYPYQANRDWRVLRNRLHSHGTTIEMMYTGEVCLPRDEEPEEQPVDISWPRVEALPGITHANVHLPEGVLPTSNCLPDMPSVLNALDFFAHPERHQYDPNSGTRTTVTVTPMSHEVNGQQQKMEDSWSMEVLPLGTYQAPPVERGSLNIPFQTVNTMDFTLEQPAEGDDPNCTTYSAEISPTMMLTSHQQHRLQAAVLQEEMPLAVALTPIVEDIRNEYAQMRQPEAINPLPNATVHIFSRNPIIEAPPPSDGFQYGPGLGLGVLSSPQIQPNFNILPPRYPVFGQPNYDPNYGQLAPRYPMFVPPPLDPNYGQLPPRYPVFIQSTLMPNYGQHPLIVQPNCIPNFRLPSPPLSPQSQTLFNGMPCTNNN